jgi:glycyl-tRNA synthetase (class II)
MNIGRLDGRVVGATCVCSMLMRCTWLGAHEHSPSIAKFTQPYNTAHSAHLTTAHVHHVQVSGRTFTPAVIEPSFGIGRIMYCMFEHSFYTRDAAAGDDVSTSSSGQPHCHCVLLFIYCHISC